MFDDLCHAGVCQGLPDFLTEVTIPDNSPQPSPPMRAPDSDNDSDGFPGPSRSQLKREALALHDLGERLVGLTPAQLVRIPLPDDLAEAVRAAQAMSAHGARRRQLRYLGKLLRRIDAEPIQRALEEWETMGLAAKRQQQTLERLCAALLEGDETAFSGFVERYPHTDRAHARQLARNAIRERERGQPPKARRALFRYLREAMGAQPDATLDDEPAL
ncbi:MAG: ribosome biogenesis factor YjgA [Gammaproteobacteria bacterium]